MLFPLTFLIVGGFFWWLMAPGLKFLPAFSRLLATPAVQGRVFGLFTGQTYLTGVFKSRLTAVRLHLKVNRYDRGYVVVALKTSGAPHVTYNDIDKRARDESSRRALFVLAREEVVIKVEDGWLKGIWKPAGFVLFPGTFSVEKWRAVLDAMDALANSLEASVPAAPAVA
jgi:hypothetical protein